jgi:hypothetical protein
MVEVDRKSVESTEFQYEEIKEDEINDKVMK